ncbi:unnamed protein product [Hymenolepis diminuta]|uniref:dihydropyrimidinase n=1 Tax=Hymenolepis diminuta TaxID=6216 RepID=A0A0R3SCV1_HYMDI|nr:unnamed protein product [Hymenolepis diminuta]VUZ51823.1 unnamed protein product [Hymenolepis diminuta]
MAAVNAQILIKNGVIVNHDGILRADVLIEGEKIKQIGQNIQIDDSVEVIDAQGKYLLPGGVDSDCRLLNPSDGIPVADDYERGSLASLRGGTTTIINNVDVCPGSSIKDTYNRQRNLLDSECRCDFAISLAVPDFSPESSNEMKTLAAEKKVVSFSFRLLAGANSTEPVLSEDALLDALELCASLGIPPSVPACGNPVVMTKIAESVFSSGITGPEGCLIASPERFEADTIYRVGLLANEAKCPVIFKRIYSPAAAKAFCHQRELGNAVFGETSIPAIGCTFSGNTVNHQNWAKAAACISDPPIRSEVDAAKALLMHVAVGDLMTVGSSHRAIANNVRAGMGLNDFRQIPVGQATASGRLSALWKIGVDEEALLDPCGFVAAVSANPARLYNLYPRKGRIAEGSDADIVIWNTESSLSSLELIPEGVEDPFDGLGCYSNRAEVVLLRGHVVVKDGEVVKSSNFRGQFISPEGTNSLVFGRMTAFKVACDAKLAPVMSEPYSAPVVNPNGTHTEDSSAKEFHFYRKTDYDNAPKEALPPGQRTIRTSVKTAQPPGGGSSAFWWNS